MHNIERLVAQVFARLNLAGATVHIDPIIVIISLDLE